MIERLKMAMRFAYITWVFAWFAAYVYAGGWRRGESKSEVFARQAARLKARLIALGPTFIKVGQMLATRADLLPIEYVFELSTLQDRVPPFPDAEAMDIIESELGRPLDEIFREIGGPPVASASLGQVYRATLLSGDEVAVKVQRPRLNERVRADLDFLRWLGGRLERHPGLFPGAQWLGAIDEFDRVIHEEMDYRREVENANRFRRNFTGWDRIVVPRIHEHLSAGRVIVMEYIEGTRITLVDELKAAGHSPRRLNELLYRAYFKQLFEDGFFHADPHPGNLLITGDGRLAVLDFGMVGFISDSLRRLMIEAFFHLYNRDIDALAEDMIALGLLAPEADMDAIRSIIRDALKRKIELRLGEVNFRELTYEFAPVVYEHPITTPAHFTFLMRALMTLEGISIVMNPEFNFFEVARPYVKGLLFRLESAELRRLALASLRDVRTGRFEWSRLWNLAKLACSLYFNRP